MSSTLARTLVRPTLRLATAGSARMQSTITAVSTLKDFQSKIATDKLTVTDFHAVWCAPCRAVAPVIEQFAQDYPGVQFLKVDIDEAGDIAQEYGISAVPTFVLYKDGEPVGKVVGAAPSNVKSAIETYK